MVIVCVGTLMYQNITRNGDVNGIAHIDITCNGDGLCRYPLV